VRDRLLSHVPTSPITAGAPPMNLADFLIHTTAAQPDRAALRLGDATTCYA
jgi:hypothetical protein